MRPAEPGPMTSAEAIALIEAAARPEDLFGAGAARQYRELARLTHPDARPGDRRAAGAFAKLARLWRHPRARPRPVPRRHREPLPGTRRAAEARPRPGRQRPAAPRGAGPRPAARPGRPAVPGLLPAAARGAAADRPRHRGAAARQPASGSLDGFVSLSQVRAAYPRGVDPRDAAWMWRRLLVAIGVAHRAGLVHGAVLPDHVLIHPAEHGLVLVDWCYSGPAPAARVPAAVARFADWYPPEVLTGASAGPDLDIWLATRCMTALIGDRLPAPLAAFARGCMLASPRRRPQRRLGAAGRARRAAGTALRTPRVPPLRHAGVGNQREETTMGSGRWSTDVYDAAARYRAATARARSATATAARAPVHPALDPFDVHGRESRDSDEHPQSLAIAVLFDVTGSMGGVPRTLQKKLPQLLGLLLRKGYATDPQIMFGAIGDATCDRAPLQVGQFESDNRMDDDLEPDPARRRRRRPEDRVLRAGDVLHGPAHRRSTASRSAASAATCSSSATRWPTRGSSRARCAAVIGDETAAADPGPQPDRAS